ncbi:hypothetical protein TNCV_2723321 [Trichonephila clavipes]|nr:hypothetical protein TNCV_2723321 [Trichonephila clavipes]
MPSEQRGMSPKKRKDIRRPLEHLQMWNEFVCQFRPVCDNDPTVLTCFSKKGILTACGYNNRGVTAHISWVSMGILRAAFPERLISNKGT